MATFRDQFGPLVKQRIRIGLQNTQFFWQTKLASTRTTAIWFCLTLDWPFYDWTVSCVLEIPYQLRKLSLVSLWRVFKALNVVVITSFKIRFTAAIICHCLAIWYRYGCFVDHTSFATPSIERAGGLIPAVAWKRIALLGWWLIVEYTLIVISNNTLHVRHTAIT